MRPALTAHSLGSFQPLLAHTGAGLSLVLPLACPPLPACPPSTLHLLAHSALHFLAHAPACPPSGLHACFPTLSPRLAVLQVEDWDTEAANAEYRQLAEAAQRQMEEDERALAAAAEEEERRAAAAAEAMEAHVGLCACIRVQTCKQAVTRKYAHTHTHTMRMTTSVLVSAVCLCVPSCCARRT